MSISNLYTVKSPQTQQEWDDYYELRWRILREPWQQSCGSEKDELEDTAFHCMAVDTNNKVVGVGRIHKNSTTEAQVRYMAVNKDHRYKGIGSKILAVLERHAISYEVSTISLNAREKFISFYLKHGYVIIDDAHTLFGSIRHKRMHKYIQ